MSRILALLFSVVRSVTRALILSRYGRRRKMSWTPRPVPDIIHQKESSHFHALEPNAYPCLVLLAVRRRRDRLCRWFTRRGAAHGRHRLRAPRREPDRRARR